MGGGTTDANGAYRFEVRSTAPARSDGQADLYVDAAKPAPPGGIGQQDSLLVTITLVPFGTKPLTTTVATPLRLR